MTGRSTKDEFDLVDEDEKNKLEELKVIIVISVKVQTIVMGATQVGRTPRHVCLTKEV